MLLRYRSSAQCAISAHNQNAAVSFATRQQRAKPLRTWYVQKQQMDGKASSASPSDPCYEPFPHFYPTRSANATRRWHKYLICMVRPAGIEPATPAFGGQYSIH